MEPVFDFVPQRRSTQGLLDNFIKLDSSLRQPVDPNAISYIVIHRHGKRIRSLKNHTNPAPELNHIHVVGGNVFAIQFDFTLEARARNKVVHSIQGTQKSGLSTS